VGERLKAVKEQLRGVPGRGIGYGLLRYGDELSVREELERTGSAEVSFNYLGQWDQALDEAGIFRVARESAGAGSERGEERGNPLQVIGRIAGRRLRLSFGYSEAVHERETIENLAESCRRELEAILEHCEEEGAGGYTPSDFPLSGLDQESLDRLVDNEQGIEDIYPLSPLQQGLLFNSLYSPQSGHCFVQVGWSLNGDLDITMLKQSVTDVINRHPPLRTRFAWEQLAEPVQIVQSRVSLGWEEEDWQYLSEAEHRVRFRSWLTSDHRRGFELTQAPLMRCALMKLGRESYYFVWSFHHTLIDGWSGTLLMEEVSTFYEDYCLGSRAQLPARRPYRDYIAWLLKQDLVAGERFWRRMMMGFSHPTSLVQCLGGQEEKESDESIREVQLELSRDLTIELEKIAQLNRLTMNTLAQGAWALLLSYYSGEEDVVFGTVVSGRPVELPEVETMVGLFIHTLPMRTQVKEGETLSDWLRSLQEIQIETRQYEYYPLSRIQGLCDIPRGTSLFETIVIFDNYPKYKPLQKSKLEFRSIYSMERTHRYPISLILSPGSKFRFRIVYDSNQVTQSAADCIASELRELFSNYPQNFNQPLSLLKQLLIDFGQEEKKRLQKELEDQGQNRLLRIQRKLLSFTQERQTTESVEGAEKGIIR
jgi:non-ribosomal peptide synthase protein (TIGR01720 family)